MTCSRKCFFAGFLTSFMLFPLLLSVAFSPAENQVTSSSSLVPLVGMVEQIKVYGGYLGGQLERIINKTPWLVSSLSGIAGRGLKILYKRVLDKAGFLSEGEDEVKLFHSSD